MPPSDAGPAPEGARGTSREVAGRAAAALVALQGLGLVSAGLFLMVRAAGHDARHRSSTEVLGALSAVVGIGVLAMARAILRRSRRARSPLLVLEIICLPVAVTMVQGGRWYVGVPLAAVAIAIVALVGMAGLLGPEGVEQE